MTREDLTRENYAAIFRPSRRQRAWRALGFGRRHDAALAEWRSADPHPGAWWTPGAMTTITYIRVSFLDRLRLLVSGKCEVELVTRTSVPVVRAESRSEFSVLAP